MAPKTSESFESWVSKFSDMVAVETIKLVDGRMKEHGPSAGRKVTAHVIGRMIGLTLYHTLNDMSKDKGLDKEAQCKYVEKNFARAKHEILEAVSAGFSGAMTTWSGKTVEYYCQVKIAPEPDKKKVC